VILPAGAPEDESGQSTGYGRRCLRLRVFGRGFDSHRLHHFFFFRPARPHEDRRGPAAPLLLGAGAVARVAAFARWPLDTLGGAALGAACVGGAAWWHEARRARFLEDRGESLVPEGQSG
jgi:hypothetical protein